jgi:prevent-host-death family protein
MKDISAVRSIVPLGEFKAKAASILRALDEPLIVTQNGRAAAVLLSPEQFDEMRDHNRYLEALARGLADAESGQMVEHEAVKAWLRSWGTDKPKAPPQ